MGPRSSPHGLVCGWISHGGSGQTASEGMTGILSKGRKKCSVERVPLRMKNMYEIVWPIPAQFIMGSIFILMIPKSEIISPSTD